MTMGIYQIAFIVVALACSATSKGYGPATGGPSRNIGGVSRGSGGYTTGNAIGGVGGRASIGGMGSYTGGIAGAGPGGIGSYTSGIIGARPGGIGGYTGGITGARPGGIGGYTGGITGARPGAIGQPGGFVGAPGYEMSPQPYSTTYETTDEQGGIQFKTESGDGSGNVQGNYGYFDSQGLYRQVEYTADQFGFRANIKTNEPGVGKESPADVNMIVEQTPAGIQEQYTPATAYPTGISGGPGVGDRAGMIDVSGRPGSGVQAFVGGMPVGPASGGQAFIGGGMPVAPASLQYQGQLGGRIPGTSPNVGGSGPQSVSSKQFAGIKKSSAGKSTY